MINTEDYDTFDKTAEVLVLQTESSQPNIKSSIKDSNSRRKMFSQNKEKVVSFNASIKPVLPEPEDLKVENQSPKHTPSNFNRKIFRKM